MKAMKTTAIMNLKGGVAKTITAVNMAMILAEKHGKRVLLIDADPQGNSSSFFSPEEPCVTLRDILAADSEPYWADDVQHSGLEGLDYLPADLTLAELDLMENVDKEERERRHYRLRDFVEAAAEDDAYDHVIIDMPPSFSLPARAALIAADEVIVPMKLDAFSVDGMIAMNRQIENARKLNAGLKFLGVLVTMRRGKASTAAGINSLRASRVPVFQQTIRWTDEIVDESTYVHQPLYAYSPRCGAARDYVKFVIEYLGGEQRG